MHLEALVCMLQLSPQACQRPLQRTVALCLATASGTNKHHTKPHAHRLEQLEHLGHEVWRALQLRYFQRAAYGSLELAIVLQVCTATAEEGMLPQVYCTHAVLSFEGYCAHHSRCAGPATLCTPRQNWVAGVTRHVRYIAPAGARLLQGTGPQLCFGTTQCLAPGTWPDWHHAWPCKMAQP